MTEAARLKMNSWVFDNPPLADNPTRTVVGPSARARGAVGSPSVAAAPLTLAPVRLLPLIVSATSWVITDPANVWVSSVGSNAHPQSPENAMVTAGPVHAIDTFATSASPTTPLPPASTMHACCTGLVATVTVYDAPGASSCSKRKPPFRETAS